jgi:hypothetical protein
MTITPQTNLPEFIEAFVVPSYLAALDRSPKTEREYRSAGRRWAEITGNPAFAKITQQTCAAFVSADLAKPGRHGARLSPNTVIKHCTHLQIVLDLAGPRSRQRPEAFSEEGLYGTRSRGVPRSAPYFPRLRAKAKPPEDCFSFEELESWRDACDQATEPRGLGIESTPAEWWRALIRFLYFSGLRIGTVLAIQREWIVPIGDGSAELKIPGSAYKGGDARIAWLCPEAVAVLASLPAKQRPLFSWPQSLKSLHAQRRLLLAAAGIPEARRFGFHGVRKCTLSELATNDLETAGKAGGHKNLSTTVNHYLRPSARGQVMAAQMGPVFAKLRKL